MVFDQQEPQCLFLTQDYLMRRAPGEVTPAQFPDRLDVNGACLALHYLFETGHPEAGVSVLVPRALLNLLAPVRFEWLVPGLLLVMIAALI